jgi:aldehyde dehydrogenase (NAD+)
VLKKANGTEYGLYALVYTKDITGLCESQRQGKAGTVGVNCTNPTFGEGMPFDAYKASGVGREGTTKSLDHFLKTNTVSIKIAGGCHRLWLGSSSKAGC